MWGVGLGLAYGIGAMFVEGIGLAEAFGMALGGWTMAMISHATHHFLYACKGLNPNQKPFVRITRSILFIWLLILVLILSLFIIN